jgi:hypothetical protein
MPARAIASVWLSAALVSAQQGCNLVSDSGATTIQAINAVCCSMFDTSASGRHRRTQTGLPHHSVGDCSLAGCSPACAAAFLPVYSQPGCRAALLASIPAVERFAWTCSAVLPGGMPGAAAGAGAGDCNPAGYGSADCDTMHFCQRNRNGSPVLGGCTQNGCVGKCVALALEGEVCGVNTTWEQRCSPDLGCMLDETDLMLLGILSGSGSCVRKCPGGGGRDGQGMMTTHSVTGMVMCTGEAPPPPPPPPPAPGCQDKVYGECGAGIVPGRTVECCAGLTCEPAQPGAPPVCVP